ncbi:MAG: precorrin-2 C(20)-methyltransferase [Muribaculaceae bacterium]|nr:precorrin-2 C(20)-methyltransferase [Alistipes senegalensis]MCM1472676.1 precorrin-2 C(20)-methyltransferase [Muribaculaceae bacterium]
MGKLYGVSVGAGDPELMTIKSARIISETPVIAVPETSGKSLALSIAEKIIDFSDKTIINFNFPMNKNKKILAENYDRISEKICCELAKNDVAMLSIGDISVYSTFGYVAERVISRGFAVEVCSGVPSFCAAAARVVKPLVRESENLHIIPYNREKIEKCDFSDGTYVIMKCGKNSPELVKILNEKGLTDRAFVVENCGLPDEHIYINLQDINNYSYFTLFIIKKQL